MESSDRRTDEPSFQEATPDVEGVGHSGNEGPDAGSDMIYGAPPPTPEGSSARPYPEGSIGRLMDAPVGVVPASSTVAEARERLRELSKVTFITYLYVTDPEDRLIGLIVMRDLLLAEPGESVRDIMLVEPFSLRPETPLLDAMRDVIQRHYPVYPVCDEQGRLVGLVRGQNLFAAEAIEISAQPGKMVGIEVQERLATPWSRSFRFRHPWLQINLLTGALAAGVVATFQGTIDQIVILAVFLPVLASQSGNTGAQALAVTLRGLTLGELASGRERHLVTKEGLLGLMNGAFVGLTAGLGMYLYASLSDNPAAPLLAFVVFLAMVGGCLASGIAGALVPLALRRFGLDPATASSIFLSSITDVISISLFLGLATWLIL